MHGIYILRKKSKKSPEVVPWEVNMFKLSPAETILDL